MTKVLSKEENLKSLEEAKTTLQGMQKKIKTPGESVVDAPEDAASRINKFGSALNVAIDKARQQRKDSTLDMVGGMIPAGALPASSFAGVLSAFDSDSAPLEATLLDNAMGFAQEQERTKIDAQNSIRELSLKVIEAGGSTETVASVLAFSESGDIDAAIKAAGAALSAASGDIKTVGNNLVRVMPDGTYEVIYSAPKSGGGGSGGGSASVPQGGIEGYHDTTGLSKTKAIDKIKATVDPAFFAALDAKYNQDELRQFYDFWMNLNNQDQMTVRADIALAEWESARTAAAAGAGIDLAKPKTGKETAEETIFSVTGLE